MDQRSRRAVRHLGDVHGVARGAASSTWRTHRQTESKDVPLQDVTLSPEPDSREVRLHTAKRLAEPGHTVRSRLRLLTANWFAWTWNYLKYVLRPRFRPFPTYKASLEGSSGIIKMYGATEKGQEPDGTVTVALAGDWGSGTLSAYKVADIVKGFTPDYTIHLGDVYYSGTGDEFKDFFLPQDAWPEGTVGTFALNGNHEMYSGGTAYFKALTSGEKLTYRVEGHDEPVPQAVSYFCLENEHWRIVAIDTGYYARTFPFLELLDTHLLKLHSAVCKWLDEVVFKDADDRRPVILLSHHEWFSAYDAEYKRMGKPLARYLDRVLLWFWGHEHRFSGYAPFGLDKNGHTVRARCIGHGGIPFDIAYPHRHRNLVCSDERINPESTNYVDARQQLGFCGFALLTFEGPTLSVEYYDETNRSDPLLKEIWEWNEKQGTYRGTVEGGDKLAKYTDEKDGDPKVPPKRVVGSLLPPRIKALGGTWP